jgi:hypothetical protein
LQEGSDKQVYGKTKKFHLVLSLNACQYFMIVTEGKDVVLFK